MKASLSTFCCFLFELRRKEHSTLIKTKSFHFLVAGVTLHLMTELTGEGMIRTNWPHLRQHITSSGKSTTIYLYSSKSRPKVHNYKSTHLQVRLLKCTYVKLQVLLKKVIKYKLLFTMFSLRLSNFNVVYRPRHFCKIGLIKLKT